MNKKIENDLLPVEPGGKMGRQQRKHPVFGLDLPHQKAIQLGKKNQRGRCGSMNKKIGMYGSMANFAAVICFALSMLFDLHTLGRPL